MTHRTVVNCKTGVVNQVEYTAEEQAVHDAAVTAQTLADAAALAESAQAEAQVAPSTTTAQE